MLIKKLTTAFRLFREGGAKGVYDYSWFRLQIIVKGKWRKVRLNRCTFHLDEIGSLPVRTEFITNQYEAPERSAVVRYLRRNLPVIELGGSMGVVACVTNRLLQKPTSHVVVEANPLVIPQLERNKARNHGQFEIVNQAIAYGMDSVTFRPSSNVCISSITVEGDQEPVTVRATQLGSLARDRGFERFNLVCDIEGLEYELVCHEAETLKKADTIILETHARFIGEEKNRLLLNKLESLGFKTIQQIGYVVVLRQ